MLGTRHKWRVPRTLTFDPRIYEIDCAMGDGEQNTDRKRQADGTSLRDGKKHEKVRENRPYGPEKAIFRPFFAFWG